MDEAINFGSPSPAYTWNEGLARAARHLLNEKGSCGTNADAFGFVLKSFYAWTYEDLEYETITSPYLVNDVDFTESYVDAMNYILSQDHVNKALLKHPDAREIGIGCACSGKEIQGEKSYSCIIAVASDAPA